MVVVMDLVVVVVVLLLSLAESLKHLRFEHTYFR